LQYVTDDACPFCDQPLDAVRLIRDYRSFFSREYHALREEVAGLKRQVDAAIGERVAAGLEQTVLQNANAAESWQQPGLFAQNSVLFCKHSMHVRSFIDSQPDAVSKRALIEHAQHTPQ